MSVLELKNISKSYYGSNVLEDVSFSVNNGEIFGILAMSGSGKTTLVKIISGNEEMDYGSFLYKGIPVRWKTPLDAINNGISTVHENCRLINNLTVAENVFIYGYAYKQRLMKRFSLATMSAVTQDIFDRMGLIKIDTFKYAYELMQYERLLVQIAAAIGRDPEILLLDDPFVQLSRDECEKLIQLITHIRDMGITVVITTSNIDTVTSVCDRAAIIKEGRSIEYEKVSLQDVTSLAKAMSDTVTYSYPRISSPRHRNVLAAQDLTHVDGRLQNITFDLKDGEILGVAGAPGSGKSTLIRALFGLEKLKTGIIYISGQECKIHCPTDAIAHGIGFVSSVDSEYGLLPMLSAMENFSLSCLRTVSSIGIVNKRKEKHYVRKYFKKYSINAIDINEPIINMRNGDRQKLQFCKWLMNDSRIILMDDPTRGIGISAKVEMYNLINNFVLKGGSIILSSTDLNELLGMCDRVLIMRQGSIIAILEKSRLSMRNIICAISGVFT